MRRVEQLITQVRRATENTRIGTQDGISDEEFIQYLNDAQERLYSEIIQIHRTAFSREFTFSAPGTEDYTLPTDVFGKQRIISVEFTQTGTVDSYYFLDQARIIERQTRRGYPSQYILLSNKLLLNAYPDQGTFRMIYDPLIARLDKRRSQVSTFTYNTTTRALTALTLTTAAPFSQADYSLYDTLSVVGEDGTVKLSGVPYTAVSAGGVVTIRGGTYTAPVGSSIAASDWICLGTNSTTTSQLTDECEKYLLAYCQRRIMDRDSSSDRMTMKEDEAEIMADIIGHFADIAGDMDQIPVKRVNYFDDLW